MIYFALLDNDDVIDCIPLYEITLVKKMGSDAGNDLNLSNFHRKTSPHSGGGNEQLSSDGFHQTLRIDTKPEGYNSGRTYYLQIGSDAEFSRLAISLLFYVKDAIKRFEAKTGLERSQAKVRRLFRSPPFQFAASFFILAVIFRFSFFLFASKLLHSRSLPLRTFQQVSWRHKTMSISPRTQTQRLGRTSIISTSVLRLYSLSS